MRIIQVAFLLIFLQISRYIRDEKLKSNEINLGKSEKYQEACREHVKIIFLFSVN